MEPMTAEQDLGIGRKPSPFDAHPLISRPNIKNLEGLDMAQEFAGGAPRHEKPRSVKQATDRLAELVEPEDGSGNVPITHPGFSAYLSAAVIQLDDLVPSRRWSQASELVKQVKAGMMSEFLTASKEVGSDKKAPSLIQLEYRLSVGVLSDIEVLVDRLVELPADKGAKEVKAEKESPKVAEGAEKKVEENNGEKITKENWLKFAHRLLNSDGPPIAGYGVYGQMDEVAEGITTKLESLARVLEEGRKAEDVEIAKQIRATVHLRHCAYVFMGMPPIKVIQNRIEKVYSFEASKARLLSGPDLDLLLGQEILDLKISEALDEIQQAYLSGSVTKKGISDIEKQAVFNGIIEKIGGDEKASLSFDYANNLAWALGLVAEWNKGDRRATNLAKLFFFADYRRAESDIADGGMPATKDLIDVFPVGSFLRSARTNHPYPEQFMDSQGRMVTAKGAEFMFLVNLYEPKPEEYDPYYFTGTEIGNSQARLRFRYTGWFPEDESMVYVPINFKTLDYKSLPQGAYENWLKNVRRASIVSGWLLKSLWKTGDVGSDQIQEMHGVVSELDSSDAAKLRSVLVITILKSILTEGVGLGLWKVSETKMLFANLRRNISLSTIGPSRSFISADQLAGALEECNHGSEISFNTAVAVQDNLQKRMGRLAVTGR